MKEIKLNLSVIEINTVIKALSQFPYHQVHEVISKIHQQASEQVNHENGHEKEKTKNDVTAN